METSWNKRYVAFELALDGKAENALNLLGKEVQGPGVTRGHHVVLYRQVMALECQ
jgi:hypothetical protein